MSLEFVVEAITYVLSRRDRPTPFFVLKSALPRSVLEEPLFSEALNHMRTKGNIRNTSMGIEYLHKLSSPEICKVEVLPLMDFIWEIPDSRRGLLNKYISGTSITDLAKMISRTPEETTKILRSCFKSKYSIVEDRYADDFKRCKFERDEFKSIYGETDATYRYLVLMHTDLQQGCPEERGRSREEGTPTFKHANITDEILGLIKERSPISPELLIRECERRYWKRAEIMKALSHDFNHYLNNGLYDFNIPKLSDADLDNIKRSMIQSWYLITQAEALFNKVLGQDSQKYLNAYNLKGLGYIRSDDIIHSFKYISPEKCLEDFFDNKTIFTVEPETMKISAVSDIIKRRMNRLDTIQCFETQYINLSFLKDKGIGKEQLHEYSNAVADFVEEGEYFTLFSIRNAGFEHDLDSLGFEDIFYNSILKRNPILQFREKNVPLFFRKSNDASLTDFIESVVSQVSSIDLEDLIQKFKDVYDMCISARKIKKAVDDTGMYYSKITEKVYIDYDAYSDEV